MEENKTELNFILASDENYADKLTVAMYSIFEKHQRNKKVNVHVLSNNIGADSIKKIKNCVSNFNNGNLIIHPVNDITKLLGKDVNVDHLSLAAYARLFIPEILSNEIDKAIYLDVDILVNTNLTDLFNMDLGENYLAGVKSIMDLADSQHDYNTHFHINSGVIVWNLKVCREEDFVDKCINYIRETNHKLKFHDQTTINEVCIGRIKSLPPKYNVMSGMFFLSYKKFKSVYGLKEYYTETEYDNAKKYPAIIHLTSWVVGRPWEVGCVHPYRHEYTRILNETAWKEKKMNINNKGKYNAIKRILYRTLPGDIIRRSTEIKRNVKKIKG